MLLVAVIAAAAFPTCAALPPDFFVLDPSTFAPILGEDLAWATATIPFFESSDVNLTNTYFFRWRTLKRHIAPTGAAEVPFVITEFAPLVPWAGSNNTIPCAAGHHLTEARWLRDSPVPESYARWWTSGLPGVRHNYYSWWAQGVRRWLQVAGASAVPLIRTMLPAAGETFRSYANGTLPPNGAAFDTVNDCLWNAPGNEGQENSISGPGCRPLVQALMTGEADALSELCAAAGDAAGAAEFAAAAALWRARTLRLWNTNLSSFDTLRGSQPPAPQPPAPPGYTPLANASNTFCCDQAPCVDGHSRFLWEGAAVPSACASRCDAYPGGACHFITVSSSGWCQNAQWCNATNSFAGGSAWTFERNAGEQDDRQSAPEIVWQGYAPRGDARGDRHGAPAPLPAFAGVRELASLTSPWLFGAVRGVTAMAQFADSWNAVFDPEGLGGPRGLRTAEARHPSYRCGEVGCCEWAGPVWPFETSKALRAAMDVLQAPAASTAVPALTRTRVWAMLEDYTRMHVPGVWTIINGSHGNTAPADPRVLAPFFLDGAGEAWIAEAGCGDSGRWTDDPTEGYWYNHATFVDHVLSGVAGIAPGAWAASGAAPSVAIAPLAPTDATLEYFCADAVRVGGHTLTVLWDADGSRYSRGRGLTVLVDGEVAAHADTLLGLPLVVGLEREKA